MINDNPPIKLPDLISAFAEGFVPAKPLSVLHIDPEGALISRVDLPPKADKSELPSRQEMLESICGSDRLSSRAGNPCLVQPLAGGGSLAICSASGPLNGPDQAAAQILLKAMAREIQVAAELKTLQEQAEFGEKVVQSMSSGFMVLRPDLVVLNANKAACDLLQTTEDKLVGSRLSDFIFSKLLVKQVFATGKAVTDKEVFIKLADRDIHILKTAVPVLGPDGSVIAVLDHFREINEAHRLVNRLTGSRASFTFEDIIHQSPVMEDVIELSRMAAGNSLSVLITGESGTGKELFAHAIHLASPRRKAPFVVIDCASMPRELVASELFGYMEGAFTGARKGGAPGKFELANGGTVFLDELGELPLEIQSQFLRVLQTRQVMRLGGKDMLPVDIRVIAATNRDLAGEVKNGNFREDLYYRLNVLAVHIPALRARPDDVFKLVDYFLKKYSQIVGKGEPVLSAEAREALLAYPWPGNVRELENIVAKAVHIADGMIETSHLRLAEPGALNNGLQLGAEKVAAPGENVWPASPSAGSSPISFKDMETKAIREAIAACGGNISRAAKMLGVARSTIYKKMAAWP